MLLVFKRMKKKRVILKGITNTTKFTAELHLMNVAILNKTFFMFMFGDFATDT